MPADQETSNLRTTALYIGVPVLIGASCYYLYKSSRGKSKNKLAGGAAAKPRQLSPHEQILQYKQLGNQNFVKNKYEAAIELYTKAINLNQTLGSEAIKPHELAIFHQNIAACLEGLEKYDEAVKECDRAIELNKQYSKAYLRRAKARAKLGDHDKASVDIYSASLLDKFQNQSYLLATEEIISAASRIKAKERLKDLEPTWPNNHTIKSYFAAFVRDPVKDKLDGLTEIDLEKMQQLLDEANKPENDNDPLSLLIKGTFYCLMDQRKVARECFDKILEFDDETCPVRYKSNASIKKATFVIGETNATTQGDIAKCIEKLHDLLGQAMKIDPENPDIFLHKAQFLVMMENFEEALEWYDKTLALEADHPVALGQKFLAQFRILSVNADPGEKESLLEGIKNAVSKYSDSVDLQYVYVQILQEMNYFELAELELEKTSKAHPNDAYVLMLRGMSLFHMSNSNDFDQVIQLLKEALKIDPKMIYPYEILGSLLSQQGKIEEAAEIFEQAVKYSQSENDLMRSYASLLSIKGQKRASELLGMSVA